MKLTVIVLSACLLIACGGKKGTASKDKEPAATTGTAAPASGKDAELSNWLKGKRLVSTQKDPKYDMWNDLKLYADGTCKDKDNASAKWSVRDGKFIFESAMNISKEMEKKDDTTLVFKEVLGDELYILKPVN